MQAVEKSRRDTRDLKREKTNYLSEYSELIAALGPPPSDELWLVTAVTSNQLTFDKRKKPTKNGICETCYFDRKQKVISPSPLQPESDDEDINDDYEDDDVSD